MAEDQEWKTSNPDTIEVLNRLREAITSRTVVLRVAGNEDSRGMVDYAGYPVKILFPGEYTSPHNGKTVNAHVVEFADGSVFLVDGVAPGTFVTLTRHQAVFFRSIQETFASVIVEATKLLRSVQVDAKMGMLLIRLALREQVKALDPKAGS